MTKPIEWRREIKSTETTVIRTRIAVQELDRYGSTIAVFAATPADIVAALAAMPEGERAEVLRASGAFCVATEVVTRKEYDAATARAEKAEAEITEVRRVLGVRENAVTASTAAWRMGEITAATVRAEKAERERDKAVALQDVAVNRLAVLERERDAARSRGQDALARAEKAERESRCFADSAAANLAELHRAEVRIEELMAELNKAERECAKQRELLELVRDQRDAETIAVLRATARAEKAERERSEWRTQAHHELGARPNESMAEAAIRMRTRAEKAERDRDEARLELDRVRASLDVVRHDLAGTRQELREAREARDRSARLRDAMMPDTRAALDAAHDEDAVTAARRVVSERDSLRSRLIAAESAAAAREPREYPLAEGSRFEGPSLVTAGKARVNIRPYLGDGPPTLSMELLDGSAYWVYLADVLALAHRRGLL